jgi:predicted Fe-Mo cluster-binding NifX family protein
MRIAVVSSDRVLVDERFTQADRFLIYEKEKTGLRFIGERVSEPLPFGIYDRDMLEWVADIIDDCDMVFMAQIQKEPAQVLSDRGIIPVIYKGPIADIRA